MSIRRVVLTSLCATACFSLARPSAAAEPSIVSVVSITYGPAPLDMFRRPQGIATDPGRGMILVTDTGNRRLATFDATSRSRGVVVFSPAPGEEGREPRAVAVGERLCLFLVDGLTREVEVLSPRGRHLGYLPSLVPADLGVAARPQDVAVGPGGRLHVLYAGERPGIAVAEVDGTLIRHIGFEPVGQGPFLGPVALDVDATGTLIAVGDPMAERPVLLFTAEGTPLAAFGKHGEGNGTFSMVSDVTWGPGGKTLWVTDTGRHSISVFDPKGSYLCRIGGFGLGPGQFDYPAGCAFLADDRLAVLERAGARFQVLEVSVPASDPAGADLEQVGSGRTGASLATLQGRF